MVVSDVPNPFADSHYQHRFLHTFNKLLGWSLTEYKRVVMLDADNLFLQNIDELFQCGKFCAAFINPCTYHTGLFVLEVRLIHKPCNHDRVGRRVFVVVAVPLFIHIRESVRVRLLHALK